jgi:hypothetical protein
MALSQAQIDTAMKSPQHLRAWLDASGRRWLVLNGMDLVDAVQHPWPAGVLRFMQTVMAYRDHRRTIWTGRTQRVTGHHPATGEPLDQEVKVMKGEALEIEELDRAIRYLTSQILERDPSWSIEKPAL